MRATFPRVMAVSLILAAMLGLTILASLAVGSVGVRPEDVLAWLGGREVDHAAAAILGRLRLPRILLAALAGGALSLCGAAFQALLRNPLADPFILGVSGGAAAGAVLALALGLPGLFPRGAAALMGALAAMSVVLSVARRRGRMETATLILAGVMVNSFFTAAIMYFISTASEDKVHAILFWLYGDLSAAHLDHVRWLWPALLVGGGVLLALARHLNLLAAGDAAAAALGVQVEKVKLRLLLVVSLLSGLTVSLTGIIGFVGLMVPHLARMVLGPDHRLLLPASALLGSIFLVACDTAARTLISPAQLPVGVVTAALGAPFFLFLLSTRGSRWW